MQNDLPASGDASSAPLPPPVQVNDLANSPSGSSTAAPRQHGSEFVDCIDGSSCEYRYGKFVEEKEEASPAAVLGKQASNRQAVACERDGLFSVLLESLGGPRRP